VIFRDHKYYRLHITSGFLMTKERKILVFESERSRNDWENSITGLKGLFFFF